LFFGQSIAKNFIACKIKSSWLWFWFIGKESGASRFLPTKRAVDLWDSAASTSIFLASGFFCSQAFSQPAHKPLTQTVRRFLLNRSKGVGLRREVVKVEQQESFSQVEFRVGQVGSLGGGGFGYSVRFQVGV
jgi:hypothetical protein